MDVLCVVVCTTTTNNQQVATRDPCKVKVAYVCLIAMRLVIA